MKTQTQTVKSSVSQEQGKILNAIAGGATRNADIASKTKRSASAVSQSVKRLEGAGMVKKLRSGDLKVSAAGHRALGEFPEPRDGSKTAKAYPIIEKMRAADAARKDIVAELVKRCKLTTAGASTYISNWDKANGHSVQ